MMVKYHYRPYERKPFDAENCTRCGLCLENCPQLHLNKTEAKKAIETLAAGGSVPKVENACVSCFTCNTVCPNDCRPTNLFLDKWHDAYEKEGLAERAQWFLPLTVPNFRTYFLDRMPADEKAAITQWASLDPVPGGEILYPGCNVIVQPYLTFSKMFDGVTFRGTLQHCCGEMYFRMGLYEQVEQIAQRVTHYFRDQLQVQKIWTICVGDLDVLTNTLPQFGADLSGIKIENYQNVILQKLESGELEITHPLSGTVTLQDSCHGRTFNPEIFEIPRKILHLIGLEVLEAPHSKEAQICCGIACGFSHESAYSKMNLIKGVRRAYANVKKPGAKYISTDCSGCLQSFSFAQKLSLSRPPAYHILELVQLALGETLRQRNNAIGSQFFSGGLRYQKGSRLAKLPPIPLIPT